MRIDARKTLIGLVIAGVAGAFLFLPAVVYLGTFLTPTEITPGAAPVPPMIADALWARANGGRATALEPINAFTFGRMAVCQVWAGRGTDVDTERAERDECMRLMPGLQAVGYVSSLHLQSQGVWEDPRVPFVQVATMTRVTDKWTRAELIATLAERAEFGDGIRGLDAAARGYFGKSTTDLTLPQAALIAALLGDRRLNPWCSPETAASARQRILARMRDNLAIDDAAFAAADRSALGLAEDPPEGHRPCDR